MSAWHVWTAFNMYPMNPATGDYVFGYWLMRPPLNYGIAISIEMNKLGGNQDGLEQVMRNRMLLQELKSY